MLSLNFRITRRACALVALAAMALFGGPVLGAADEKESSAAEPKVTLHVGDPAPKLYVAKWLKGEPVEKFEKGKVYVIECWATWCGPCVAAIPHVTELQKKYKENVTVIGMNVWEHDVAAAEPFVKKMGEKMEYAVATDEGGEAEQGGKSAKAWLAAAGQNGIPCSFIVDQEGKVAWIGHPMSMERPLGLIVEGKFDPKKEAEAELKAKEIQAKFVAAAQAKEWDKAAAAVDELAAVMPSFAKQAPLIKLSLLVEKKDFDALNKEAARLADDQFKDDAAVQIQIASVLLEAADAGKADLDLALKLAEKGYAAHPDDLDSMKTTAEAYAAKKQFAKAAEVQGKLVEKVSDRFKDREKKVLEEYKSKAGGGGEKK